MDHTGFTLQLHHTRLLATVTYGSYTIYNTHINSWLIISEPSIISSSSQHHKPASQAWHHNRARQLQCTSCLLVTHKLHHQLATKTDCHTDNSVVTQTVSVTQTAVVTGVCESHVLVLTTCTQMYSFCIPSNWRWHLSLTQWTLTTDQPINSQNIFQLSSVNMHLN